MKIKENWNHTSRRRFLPESQNKALEADIPHPAKKNQRETKKDSKKEMANSLKSFEKWRKEEAFDLKSLGEIEIELEIEGGFWEAGARTRELLKWNFAYIPLYKVVVNYLRIHHANIIFYGFAPDFNNSNFKKKKNLVYVLNFVDIP